MIVHKYFPTFVDHDASEAKSQPINTAEEALEIPWVRSAGGRLYIDGRYVMTEQHDGKRWVVAIIT